jgi:lysophospholipid acyltransferase (LPLAT)-like uncharacterized protein
VAPIRPSLRRLRFTLLEHLALPIGVLPLKALMRTWRLRPVDEAMVEPFVTRPRLVIATCHGMFLHVLAFSRLAAVRHRRFVVLLGPSRDGRLLAAFLARFGIGHAVGATGSRGAAGAHAFVQRVAAGEIGILAVDGPLGPCCQVAPGFLRLAAAAGAEVQLMITSASRGHTFASWDRAHLPAPFATVRGWATAIPLSPHRPTAEHVADLQRQLIDAARLIESPVLPEALRAAPSGPRRETGDGSRHAGANLAC